MPIARSMHLRLTPLTAYLAVGAALVAVHWLLPTGSLTQSFLYDVIGVRLHRPDRALPWLLMAAGQALFVAGDLLWNWYEVIGEDPFPSLADVLYLAGYPFIAVGLLLLIHRRL